MSVERMSKKQLQKGLSLFLAFWGATIGYQIAHAISPGISREYLATIFPPSILIYVRPSLVFFLIIGCAIIGYFLSSTMMKALNLATIVFDNMTRKFSWQELSSIAVGMISGLIVANLLALPLWSVPFGEYPAVLLNLILGVVGARVFQRRQKEARAKGKKGFFTSFAERGAYDRNQEKCAEWSGEDSFSPEPERERKILDTSVIVDGRILDVARTGFLSGILVIPEFVLLELQGIADSSDPSRRMRGRRGLDVVNELQNINNVTVEISQSTVKDLGVESVDSALLALGKRMNAPVLTTDYNLGKVAQIHDVSVLNINDLANAIKPLLLPGDFIEIDVIREGKDTSQGVGYLDDGTMCVVEDGAPFIGQKVEIMVTSMLQTSAGRMIFGRTRKEGLKE